MNTKNTQPFSRAPIVGVFGHIDHGKSTLLDYIRKENTVEAEAGGITQRLSAYELTHTTKDGATGSITFLDTPGHEAFHAMRNRGASVADIAILVIAADEGVKPQTLEAHKSIVDANIPYVVAFTKIDKNGASIEKAQASTIENQIYLEKLGGDVPWVAVSSKSGEGIDELLDIILLLSELQELSCKKDSPAVGIIIEAHRDPKKGTTATAVITDGTLKKGEFVLAGDAIAPLRLIEDHTGAQIESAYCGMPVRIAGFSSLPEAGASLRTFSTKKEAESQKKESVNHPHPVKSSTATAVEEDVFVLPIILKADVAGSLDAIEHELKKIEHEGVLVKTIATGVGAVSEGDVKTSLTDANTIIVAFNVSVETSASELAERNGITIGSFDIIYNLTEWLEEEVKNRIPKKEVREQIGKIKILKTFSKTKDKQVLGGRVESGILSVGATVQITRHDMEIGEGKVLGLQAQKSSAQEISEGSEFGAEIESKTEIAPGDKLEAYRIVVV